MSLDAGDVFGEIPYAPPSRSRSEKFPFKIDHVNISQLSAAVAVDQRCLFNSIRVT